MALCTGGARGTSHSSHCGISGPQERLPPRQRQERSRPMQSNLGPSLCAPCPLSQPHHPHSPPGPPSPTSSPLPDLPQPYRWPLPCLASVQATVPFPLRLGAVQWAPSCSGNPFTGSRAGVCTSLPLSPSIHPPHTHPGKFQNACHPMHVSLLEHQLHEGQGLLSGLFSVVSQCLEVTTKLVYSTHLLNVKQEKNEWIDSSPEWRQGPPALIYNSA